MTHSPPRPPLPRARHPRRAPRCAPAPPPLAAPPPAPQAPPASAAGLPDVTPAQRAFRRLRARLHADGWWEREWGAEARQLACWAACVGVAVALARGGAAGPVWGPRLAFLPLGLSFTAAGWLAHDYIHGRGPFCSAMRCARAASVAAACCMWVGFALTTR